MAMLFLIELVITIKWKISCKITLSFNSWTMTRKTTLQSENQLKKFLTTLKKSETMTQATYDRRYRTGSRISILYGLPKIHKNNILLRPILSYPIILLLLYVSVRKSIRDCSLNELFCYFQDLHDFKHQVEPLYHQHYPVVLVEIDYNLSLPWTIVYDAREVCPSRVARLKKIHCKKTERSFQKFLITKVNAIWFYAQSELPEIFFILPFAM